MIEQFSLIVTVIINTDTPVLPVLRQLPLVCFLTTLFTINCKCLYDRMKYSTFMMFNIQNKTRFNPKTAEFHKQNNLPSGFLELHFQEYQDENLIWSAYSIELGQTAWMFGLVWLYTGGKG